MENRHSDSPLWVRVEGDELVISIGVDRLNGNDYHPEIPELEIKDREQWVKDIISVMTSDDEQGVSFLTDLFDKSMVEAIEQGSCGLSEDSPTHIGECVKCGEIAPVRHASRGETCNECFKK